MIFLGIISSFVDFEVSSNFRSFAISFNRGRIERERREPSKKTTLTGAENSLGNHQGLGIFWAVGKQFLPWEEVPFVYRHLENTKIQITKNIAFSFGKTFTNKLICNFD
jgi:hypothetical protein